MCTGNRAAPCIWLMEVVRVDDKMLRRARCEGCEGWQPSTIGALPGWRNRATSTSPAQKRARHEISYNAHHKTMTTWRPSSEIQNQRNVADDFDWLAWMCCNSAIRGRHSCTQAGGIQYDDLTCTVGRSNACLSAVWLATNGEGSTILARSCGPTRTPEQNKRVKNGNLNCPSWRR